MKREMLEKVYNAQKNLIVSGDISTGKTTSILFPLVDKMIEKEESLLILDSKEEYINKYHNKLKEKNYNIVVLNLRDLDKSDGWNPIQLAYELYKKGNTDKAMDYLEKTAKTMFYEDASNDPFWSLSASDFFTGVALALFEDGKEDEINLNSINMMFEGVNERFGGSDYLTNYFKLKDPSSQSYVCASTTILAPKETKGSIMSVAKQKLRTYVSREKLSLLMNKTTFNYEDMANKPTAIFFIAKDESKYLNTLAAMFIEQLFTVLFDMKSSNKFNFVLDNFDIIENVNEFVDMLGSGLSRKIKFYISTRSLEDLSVKYGNYITKLSNEIYTASALIKVRIDDKEETIENKVEKIIDVYHEVDYPKLDSKPIKIFNLKEFVHEAKKNMMEGKLNELPPLSNPFENNFFVNQPVDNEHSIDDLIKKIDDKIEELDAQEKMYQAEKQNIEVESEISKFKIDEENK